MTEKRKECSWWRGHSWQTDGLTGPLSMRETCTRCGLAKVFNGAIDETVYYWPKEAREGEQWQCTCGWKSDPTREEYTSMQHALQHWDFHDPEDGGER